MSTPTISVIVPVYNAKKYLHRCIDSILSQTFTDFELLLIDDGSKDKSGAICDEYAVKDNRVRVFHKENGGVSSARNLGLDNAEGEYVTFVDADDYWLEDTALMCLLNLARTYELDVIRGEYVSVDANGNRIIVKDYTFKKSFECKKLEANEFLKNVVCGEFFLPLCLVRRNVIGQLRFDENQVFLEDMKFYMQILLKQPKCGYVQSCFYAYRKTDNSASSSHRLQHLKDSFEMCDFFWNSSSAIGNEGLKKTGRFYSVMMYYWTLQTLASDSYYANRKSIIDELRLNELHKKVVSRMQYAEIKRKYQVFIYPIPSIGVKILHVKDKIRALLS